MEIHSDQGKNFESSLFAKICKLFEIKKTRTTSNRPYYNGIIKKFNGTLEKMIRSFVDKNATNWDLYIGVLMAAYRSTPHPATEYSSIMLMFGREVDMPNQLLFPLPSSHTYLDPDYYVASIKDKLEEIYHSIRKNLNMSAVTQKKNYDTRISQTQFSRGTLVYKFNNVFKRLEERWSGPYVVTDVLSPVLYKLENQGKCENVHRDRLRLYMCDDVPSWVHKVLKKATK